MQVPIIPLFCSKSEFTSKTFPGSFKLIIDPKLLILGRMEFLTKLLFAIIIVPKDFIAFKTAPFSKAIFEEKILSFIVIFFKSYEF